MFSDNFKNIRREKGLSQQKLAEKLNVVRQTISKWEKGLSVPDSEMLVKISETLGIPVGVLLDEKYKNTENREDIKTISAKLEMLEAVLAKKQENKRKILRTVSVIAVVLAAAMFMLAFSVFFYNQSMNTAMENASSSEAITGGADMPTGIHVISTPLSLEGFIIKNIVPFTIFIAAAAVSVIGIIKTKKK